MRADDIFFGGTREPCGPSGRVGQDPGHADGNAPIANSQRLAKYGRAAQPRIDELPGKPTRRAGPLPELPFEAETNREVPDDR